MRKPLPDKYVRKAIYDLINDMIVDGVTVPCFDTRVYGNQNPQAYVLMTTQTNLENKANKCEHRWDSSILLDIVTRYSGTNNPGSRLLADNIVDQILTLTGDLQLDPVSNLSVFSLTYNLPPDLPNITKSENIFRKFIRYDLIIE